ncbi:MAG: nucleotidyltransferase, partial [Bacteroidales bacterium]|nr:nucleotidyltransferase [Bacteroidales bacterium]
MTDSKDIRWEQRFSNYRKALKKLSEAIDYVKKDLETKNVIIENTFSEDVLEEI